jgi:hypothetical protein
MAAVAAVAAAAAAAACRLRELVEEVRAMPAEPPTPFIKPDLSSLPAPEPAGSLSQLAAKRFRVSGKVSGGVVIRPEGW